MTRIIFGIVTFALLASVAAPGSATTAATAPGSATAIAAGQSAAAAPVLTGIWESERCAVQEREGSRTSSKSLFVFLAREWAIEVTQFADAECMRPAMKAFFSGSYTITQPSAAVAGAYDATFGFSYKALTLSTRCCWRRSIAERAARGPGSAASRRTFQRQVVMGRAGLRVRAGIRPREADGTAVVPRRAAETGTGPLR